MNSLSDRCADGQRRLDKYRSFKDTVSTKARQPRQARSQRTADNIIEATLEIIAESGLAGVTVAAVARRAGAPNGSIYHLFRDKQTLLHEAQKHFLSRLDRSLRRGIERGNQASNLADCVNSVCGAFVQVFAQEGPLLRPFLIEGRSVEVLRETGTATALSNERLVADVFRRHANCSEADAAWAVYLLVAAQLNHIIFDDPMFMLSTPDSQEEFSTQLAESLIRVLTPPPRSH